MLCSNTSPHCHHSGQCGGGKSSSQKAVACEHYSQNFPLLMPCRHGVGKTSSHSEPRHDMVVGSQLHAPAALSSVKYPAALTEVETGWSPVTLRPLKEKKKFSCHCQESNHFSLVVQPVDQSLYWLCYPSSVQRTQVINTVVLWVMTTPILVGHPR